MEHFKQAMAKIEAGFGYIDGGIDMESEGRSLEANFCSGLLLISRLRSLPLIFCTFEF